MTKIIMLVAFGLFLIPVLIAAMRPDHFRITRSATIPAVPSVVFAQVNDYHNWQAWSPWAKMDPNSKATFDGPSAGTGSMFTWSGNDKVGEGTMKITESRPDELILMDLDFRKPFKARNVTEFTFKPEGNGTAVTWTMSGKNNLMAKTVGLFLNVDKMVGGQFEQGLENLNSVVAAEANKSQVLS